MNLERPSCGDVKTLGVPWGNPNSWMVYFMEHPIEMDDVGVPPWIGNLFVPKYR